MTDEPSNNNNDPSGKSPAMEEKKEYINIRVVGANQGEVYFKLKKHTPLKKLMEAYCEKQGRQPNTVRFLYDGNRVKPTDTPEQLSMENDDSIEVMIEQYGGDIDTLSHPYA